ncbi:sedoheptulose- -bisphosphatase [Cystoisospora suis]|uniref:Sedoheptulose--bisphosphatase n=1 Tax=Cystoisospora suis TaxID=483139 RepID=A0A2C6KK90_9APIC|nr:sedoheptulose- -bisphosphatase [Cystoisospora suis]
MSLPPLEEILQQQGADKPLVDVIQGLLDKCSQISDALRGTSVTSVGTHNDFGDEQLTVDVVAEKLLRTWAEGSDAPFVRAISSEEDIRLKECHEKGEFILCWDPLDGSSIVDCNWAVGTIISVWRLGVHGLEWKGADTLISRTGRQQIAGIAVIYGPRTTALVAINTQAGGQITPGTALDLELRNGKFVCMQKPVISSHAKIFAPANLRAAQDLDAYKTMIDHWMTKRFTLRYTGKLKGGGLVPDVYQIFVKKQGVFCNPASPAAPAKLRMCFEILPLALLVEAAGGRTTNGRICTLDMPIEHMDHRSAFCCGSEDEVKRFEEAMAKLF